MKGMKLNLAAIAVLLGTGAAFASSAKPANKFATRYGYDRLQAKWVTITGTPTCTGTEGDCTEQFNGDPNNGGTPIPSTLVHGEFAQ